MYARSFSGARARGYANAYEEKHCCSSRTATALRERTYAYSKVNLQFLLSLFSCPDRRVFQEGQGVCATEENARHQTLLCRNTVRVQYGGVWIRLALLESHLAADSAAVSREARARARPRLLFPPSFHLLFLDGPHAKHF